MTIRKTSQSYIRSTCDEDIFNKLDENHIIWVLTCIPNSYKSGIGVERVVALNSEYQHNMLTVRWETWPGKTYTRSLWTQVVINIRKFSFWHLLQRRVNLKFIVIFFRKNFIVNYNIYTDFNQNLLAKQVWSLALRPTTVHGQILKSSLLSR